MSGVQKTGAPLTPQTGWPQTPPWAAPSTPPAPPSPDQFTPGGSESGTGKWLDRARTLGLVGSAGFTVATVAELAGASTLAAAVGAPAFLVAAVATGVALLAGTA
ncbi:MAG TPA: hypothetical protein VNO81_02030, partial [Candidatus Nitrosotenuis sp.]|nr:hypothetical protein [Candidatus Nitrosotenuis sp.]